MFFFFISSPIHMCCVCFLKTLFKNITKVLFKTFRVAFWINEKKV